MGTAHEIGCYRVRTYLAIDLDYWRIGEPFLYQAAYRHLQINDRITITMAMTTSIPQP